MEIEKKTMQNEDRNIIQRQNKVTKELLESKLCGVPQLKFRKSSPVIKKSKQSWSMVWSGSDLTSFQN